MALVNSSEFIISVFLNIEFPSNIIINEFNEYKDINGIKFELLNKPPLIYGCHKQLSKVVKELIKNAVDYNQKPVKKVKVYYEESQKQINLYFEDNGPGIPEKYHSKVFDFFDIINEQNLNANAGIGLAIVKKIINIHNGAIKIISDGKSGSIFKISFTKALVIFLSSCKFNTTKEPFETGTRIALEVNLPAKEGKVFATAVAENGAIWLEDSKI